MAIRRLYRTARWRRLRLRVLFEQAYRCALCGGVIVEQDIDHRVPHAGNLRLFWDRDNLQGLCKSCHSTKTNEERSAIQ